MWEINENHWPCYNQDIWNPIRGMDDRSSRIYQKQQGEWWKQEWFFNSVYCKAAWLAFCILQCLTKVKFWAISVVSSCKCCVWIETHLRGSRQTQLFCMRAERHTNDEVPYFMILVPPPSLLKIAPRKRIWFTASRQCVSHCRWQTRGGFILCRPCPQVAVETVEWLKKTKKKDLRKKKRKNLADQAD